MTSLYGIVITDCIEQLPHNLTTLDITGCELSNDMQENLQVMLLLRVTMRGGGQQDRLGPNLGFYLFTVIIQVCKIRGLILKPITSHWRPAGLPECCYCYCYYYYHSYGH